MYLRLYFTWLVEMVFSIILLIKLYPLSFCIARSNIVSIRVMSFIHKYLQLLASLSFCFISGYEYHYCCHCCISLCLRRITLFFVFFQVIVKDIVSKNVIVQFWAHKSPISALCFDPSGTILVTASIQGHNINVFKIMPASGTLSASVVGRSYVHLYRLQRGFTNAVSAYSLQLVLWFNTSVIAIFHNIYLQATWTSINLY